MTRVLATSDDAGRPCPYCRFALKEGAVAERCDACSSLHHADCWRDGGGCAVHGCAMAGNLSLPAAGPGTPYPSPLPPAQAYGGYPPPPAGYPPAQPSYRARGLSPAVLAVAALIALLGIGTGVVLATGVLARGAHSNTQPRPPVTVAASTHSQTAPSTPTASEQQSDRAAIMTLLGDYQSAYSDHDLSGLSRIFSPTIVRHGLAAGGCTVSRGRSTVLSDYQSQFEEGSGSYQLVGLSKEAVALDGRSRAHLDTHYQISPGGSGYVNFSFAEVGEGWKISGVDATCE